MKLADKMKSRVIQLLAVILLTLSVCQAKMTQSKAGDPQYIEIYITLSLQEKHELEQRQGRFLIPQSFWQNAMFLVCICSSQFKSKTINIPEHSVNLGR